MKNHRVLIVFILSLAFLLTSSGSALMAGNCSKAEKQASCPSGTKADKCKTDAKCDPGQCKTDANGVMIDSKTGKPCDPAQCKTDTKCDPAQHKADAKCDKSKGSTTKASAQTTSTGCPHSKDIGKGASSGT